MGWCQFSLENTILMLRFCDWCCSHFFFMLLLWYPRRRSGHKETLEKPPLVYFLQLFKCGILINPLLWFSFPPLMSAFLPVDLIVELYQHQDHPSVCLALSLCSVLDFPFYLKVKPMRRHAYRFSTLRPQSLASTEKQVSFWRYQWHSLETPLPQISRLHFCHGSPSLRCRIYNIISDGCAHAEYDITDVSTWVTCFG